MNKKTWSSTAALILATSLAIGTVSPPAAAATVQNAVQVVQYNQMGSVGSLVLQVNGGYYYAQTAPSAPCAAHAKSADTLKAWQNLGTAALLSGKQVWVQYTTCNGYNFIEIVNLLG